MGGERAEEKEGQRERERDLAANLKVEEEKSELKKQKNDRPYRCSESLSLRL